MFTLLQLFISKVGAVLQQLSLLPWLEFNCIKRGRTIISPTVNVNLYSA